MGVTHVTERPFSWPKYTPGRVDESKRGPLVLAYRSVRANRVDMRGSRPLPEPTAPTLPLIQRTEVDGVPLLWADAPGQPILALHFRVGRADERAWEGGLTHLVEHLAMGTIGQPRYEHNAWVDTTRTVFYANGSKVDVASFGRAITTALAALPTDRLEHERSILKREAAGESPGISDSHLNFRFGMAGFGLSGQPEFGLGAVTAERVAEWARERFGRGNVMAFMTGAPPADLRLQLNEGAAFPNPRPIRNRRPPCRRTSGHRAAASRSASCSSARSAPGRSSRSITGCCASAFDWSAG